MYYSVYTKDDFFDDFPKIFRTPSEDFQRQPKIFEDEPVIIQ